MELAKFPVLLLAAVLLAGCATPGAGQGGQSANPPSSEASSNRAIVMAFRYELTSLSPKTAQAANGQMNRLFNAGLTILDPDAISQPQLAESVPQLNTGSWQILPDGGMLTSYTLRPGLTWHDGAPLWAEDFVFAWRVYSERVLSFSTKPQDLMQEVTAPDARTLTIRWKTTYPEAAELAIDFPPLPRHQLEPSFTVFKADFDDRAFLQQTLWTTDFVGVGPYRLENWVPGAQMDAFAFEGYALGKPKIPRILARIFGDENTVLANVLSREVDLAVENSMRFEHAQTLKGEWSNSGAGRVEIWPANVILNLVQFRPDYQKEPALFDLRVRKAMAYSIDRQTVQEGLYGGEGETAVAALDPGGRFYPAIKDEVTKYPYDPRETERLMSQAGFSKNRDGYFASSAGEAFEPEFQTIAGTSFERGLAIITDIFWKSGVHVLPAVMSAAQQRDNQTRATFPGIGMALTSGYNSGSSFNSADIGTPSNRWNGTNRGGWSNPEFDRLLTAFNSTLDANDRGRRAVDLYKLLSDELPGFPMYFDMKVSARATALRGPQPKATLWNLQEWELVS